MNLYVNHIVTLEIQSLNASGDGIGRTEDSSLAIFVPNTVPGDRIRARLTKLKRNYGYGVLVEILEPSADRIRPPCIVADKCGGCQWMFVNYEQQLKSKQAQVQQALTRIGKFQNPTVLDILPAQTPLGYRNKVTYPLQQNSSSGQVKAGYFQRGTHKLINLNQCPIQDESFNPLLSALKKDIQHRKWSIYNEQNRQGLLRHLGLRVGRRTGEILITLVSTQREVPQIQEQADRWLQTYPEVVGVHLNINSDACNRIFGPETYRLAGQAHLTEILAGLKFCIRPTTFFQVFTEQAETILLKITQTLDLKGHETLIDAYCGIGTLSLPLAQKVRSVLGIESHIPSIEQAQANAALNRIHNVTFQAGTVETVLATVQDTPDIIVLDPPRKGCASEVLNQIQRLRPAKMLYLSCNPSTLARDLELLCRDGNYELIWVQPVDFFPQTSHVESLAYLERVNL